MEAIDAEIKARKKALEEMDAKQRKKEEELIRVSERAKEIDFGTLGVAARSTASAPIEAGSDELSLGDTSAFEESGSAWVADDQGGLSISWTGKTASSLIGVTGLKRPSRPLPLSRPATTSRPSRASAPSSRRS